MVIRLIATSPFSRGKGELASKEIYEFKIFNMLGECVSNLTPTHSKGEGVRIDVSHLPPGVYFVRVGNYAEKFVKR